MSNILFVQAAVETLPAELEGVADEVYINFPWGSLLRAVATGEESVLRNVRRICSADAWLKVSLGLDVERDRAEIERLGLPTFSVDYVNTVLVAKYRKAGFEIVEGEGGHTALNELHTSWARRLAGSPNRAFVRIVARATGEAE